MLRVGRGGDEDCFCLQSTRKRGGWRDGGTCFFCVCFGGMIRVAGIVRFGKGDADPKGV